MKATDYKTAIILFNLGGPDNQQAVEPFLFNLFSDKAIIRLPQPLRWMVAKLISSRRAPVAKDIYAKLGGGSPILKNTQAQAQALEIVLNSSPLEGEVGWGVDEVDPSTAKAKDLLRQVQAFASSPARGEERFKCFIAMSYWHPFAYETAAQVKAYAPDSIVLLPLYPQFSTTTAAGALKQWQKVARRMGLNAPTKTICCYPDEKGFIETLASSIRAKYAEASKHGAPRVLFSAHGLPEKIIQAGDPYQWQCEQTAAALTRALNIPGLDAVLCYQSRVGPLKWIGPATDDEVRRAGADKRPVVIAPIAFVSEHSETLVEIDMEYRHLAGECGVPFYGYVPAAADALAFIEGLARLVRKALAAPQDVISGDGGRICPKKFCGCGFKN